MTNAELKTRFLVGYDAITNFVAPGYTDSEISGFLNQAMDLLIDELYSQGDITALAEILKKESMVVTPCIVEDYGVNAYQTSQLSDFRWHVNSKLKLQRNDPFRVFPAEYVPCELIIKFLADKYVQTQFNKPIIVYPKVIVESGIFVILTDVYTTVTSSNGFQIIYVKTPIRIDVTTSDSPELHVKLHQKIVDKAVQLAMKATEPQRADADIKINQGI